MTMNVDELIASVKDVSQDWADGTYEHKSHVLDMLRADEAMGLEASVQILAGYMKELGENVNGRIKNRTASTVRDWYWPELSFHRLFAIYGCVHDVDLPRGFSSQVHLRAALPVIEECAGQGKYPDRDWKSVLESLFACLDFWLIYLRTRTIPTYFESGVVEDIISCTGAVYKRAGKPGLPRYLSQEIRENKPVQLYSKEWKTLSHNYVVGQGAVDIVDNVISKDKEWDISRRLRKVFVESDD